jgi:(5-formylfuran-3-yl)methyl phosphate synthase
MFQTQAPEHASIAAGRYFNSAIPLLLVSVRNAAEAVRAIDGGCQLLDIKEPHAGPLGRADWSVITQIVRLGNERRVSVSAALGEAVEWFGNATASQESAIPAGNYGEPDTNCRPEDVLQEDVLQEDGLQFVKLGLSELGVSDSWTEQWRDAASNSEAALLGSGLRLTSGAHRVAVIYADWKAAGSPTPNVILQQALADDRIVGVLIDTWSKASGTLLDSFRVSELREISQQVQATGRFLALAGRLTRDSIRELQSVRPDVVAVRSAACRDADRTAEIDALAVQQLRAELQIVFSSMDVLT